MRSRRPVAAAVLAGAVTLAACGGDSSSSDSLAPVVRPTIYVVSTDEPVDRLLAEIYAQGMVNAGYRVGRKDPVADQATVYQRLSDGAAQFAPQFTASLLRLATEREGVDEPAVASIDEMVKAIGETLPDSLTTGDALSVQNTPVIACTTAAAETFDLATLDDLTTHAAEVRIAGTPAFLADTVAGLPRVAEVHGTEFPLTVEADPGAVGTTISAGDADCGNFTLTDPTIVLDGLLVLTDERKAIPVEAAVMLMSAATATPDVLATLSVIDGTLTTEVVRALLVKVQQADGSYAVVASEYLASQASSAVG